jgi:hypothetical protein
MTQPQKPTTMLTESSTCSGWCWSRSRAPIPPVNAHHCRNNATASAPDTEAYQPRRGPEHQFCGRIEQSAAKTAPPCSFWDPVSGATGVGSEDRYRRLLEPSEPRCYLIGARAFG